MKLRNSLLLLVVVVLITGCTKPQEITFEKPTVQIPKEQAPVKRRKGSLYSKKGTSLFADKKDLQVGDIIQVVISEALTKDTNNKRELTNDRTNNLGGGILSVPTTNTAGLGNTTGDLANKFNRNFGLGFGTTSSEDFSGEVKTKVDESFETTLSVIIQETYQNGNYYIKGSKQMLIDEQLQEIVVSGVIRPYDITPENSVQSSQIANLKVMYKKDGEEQDVMRQPWGYKIMKWIWPF